MHMLTAKNFRWLPNALTFSRAGLGVVVLLYALNFAWVAAFWVYGLALLTDFFDGLAAKKLNAYSKYGMKFDSAADGILAAAGVCALAGTGYISWWLAGLVLVIGWCMGARHYLPAGMVKTNVALEISAKIGLFAVWVFVAWYLAALAYGWHWWYILLTAAVLAGSALLKRHRLREWFGLGR